MASFLLDTHLHALPRSARLLAFPVAFLAGSALALQLAKRNASLPFKLSAVPLLLLLNSSLPFLFSVPQEEVVERALAFGLASWLGNLRLLALLFRRGQLFLVHRADPSLLPFLVAMYFPIRVAVKGRAREGSATGSDSDKHAAAHPGQSLSLLLAEAAVKAVSLFFTVRAYDHIQSGPGLLVLNSLTVFLLLSLVLDLFAILAALLTPSLLLLPHFRPPFLAASLQDFWARRWNLTMSSSLREAVYRPLLAAWGAVPAPTEAPDSHAAPRSGGPQPPSQKPPGPLSPSELGGNAPLADAAGGSRPWAHSADSEPLSQEARGRPVAALRGSAPLWVRLAAMLASFGASALLHEAFFFVVTQRVTGDMLVFFGLHGLLTAAEVAGRWALVRWCAPGKAPSLPWPLNTALVLAVLYATADRWFVGPFMSHGAVLPTINEVRGFYGLGRLASL